MGVFPHIEFPTSYSTEKLLEMSEGIKDLFKDEVEVIVCKRGPVNEVDGPWCVCLRFNFVLTDEEQRERKRASSFGYYAPEYWYMLRRDKKWGKSYGCPMYDLGQISPLGGRSLPPGENDHFDKKEKMNYPDTFFKLEEHLLSLGATKVYQFPV